MKKRVIIYNIIFVVLCILSMTLDWSKWDIADKTFSLINNLIMLFVLIMLFILVIWAIYIAIRYYPYNKIIALLPSIFIIITFLSHFVLPFQFSFLKGDYIIKQEQREQIVTMIKNKEFQQYQSGVNQYTLPFHMRFTSHVGKVFIEPNVTDVKKVLFYIHCGAFKSSAIIYTKDNENISDNDFGRIFDKIEKLDDNWYAVTMRWQS